MTDTLINGKHFYVVGMARSGLASADYLSRNGARVTVWDDSKSTLNACSAQFQSCSPDKLDWSSVDTVLLSPGVRYSYPEPHDAVKYARSKGIPVINDIILFGRLYPDALKVGITGTNGKSTTVALTAHILNGLGITALALGNIGVPVLANRKQNPTVYLVEVSSFQLELVKESPFQIAALINLSAHHLDRHGNMENYIDAKLNIFSRDEQLRVIGVEDSYAANVCRSLSISLQSKANILNVGYNDTPSDGVWIDDQRIFINIPELKTDFGNTERYHSLRGSHNHQNIATALGLIIQVHKFLGLDMPSWNRVDELLQTFESLPHRQQFVLEYKNAKIINDSKATNVTSAKRSLSAFKNILWIAGGEFKDDEMTFEKKHLKNVVHTFAFGSARKLITDATSEYKPCTTEKTLAATMEHVKSFIDSHQDEEYTVLLAPACVSFDQFADFEERGNVFMDLSKEIFK